MEDNWQWQLSHAIRDAATLGAALGLDLPEPDTGFPMLVPRPFLDRMKPGDPADPLLRQVLPIAAEMQPATGYSHDPLAEQTQRSGVLQKYAGRLLAVSTGACAINCRYCFRRHFPYGERQLTRDDWQALIARIESDSSIQELILSGGDPLVLPDRTLREVITAAAGIGHLASIRIHTRLPVVIPQRMTAGLIAMLTESPVPVTLVIHANHGNEIDASVAAALAPLRGRVQLLNQSVLLQGVNDSAEALADLSWRLHRMGVMPYYLHLLDKVAGAAHFAVTEPMALTLIQELREMLPGYLVPRLATEVPGEPAKVVLA